MRLKKEKGAVEYSLCIMLLMMGIMMLIYTMNMKIITHTKINVDDAITGANLASAVVDLKGEDGYLNTGVISNYDYQQMYNLYLDALKGSLGLDDSMNPANKVLIKSPVKVEEYIVYNVSGNDVIEKKVITGGGDPNYIKGNETTYVGKLGSVKTPDGTKVTSMTIYSKISFDIETVYGSKKHVIKQHSVDVVKNSGLSTSGGG